MARHSDRTPTHPGALLREDLLPAMGQSVTDLATRLALSKADLLGSGPIDLIVEI